MKKRKLLSGFGFLSRKPVSGSFQPGGRTQAAPDITYDHQPRQTGGVAGQTGNGYCPACRPKKCRCSWQEYGIEEPSLNRMIRLSYDLLGLHSFFTAGEDECRAWTVHRGAFAPEAAGEIHTDLQKGFIRAEVVAYDDLMALGGMKEAKGKGKLRLEGKEYIVKDGDILNIRFNL